MSKQPIEADESDEAEDRACLAVGRFFLHWAALESKMNSVIGQLFELETDSCLIITANLKFIDKLYTIGTALQWQGKVHDEKWRRGARKLINRLGRLNRSRNLMAHNLFSSMTNKCVRFYKVSARGEYELTHADWSPKDFERTYCLIDAAYEDLTKFSKELSNRKAIIRAILATQQRAPIEAPLSLGLLSRLLPQPQSPLDSGGATQGTDLQSNPTAPEKE
jgi:hypothetical protein